MASGAPNGKGLPPEIAAALAQGPPPEAQAHTQIMHAVFGVKAVELPDGSGVQLDFDTPDGVRHSFPIGTEAVSKLAPVFAKKRIVPAAGDVPRAG